MDGDMGQCKDVSIGSGGNGRENRYPKIHDLVNNKLITWVDSLLSGAPQPRLWGQVSDDGISIGQPYTFNINSNLNILNADIGLLSSNTLLALAPRIEVYAQNFSASAGTANGGVYSISGSFANSNYAAYSVQIVPMDNKSGRAWHVEISSSQKASFIKIYDKNNGNSLSADTMLLINETPVHWLYIGNDTLLGTFYNGNNIYIEKVFVNGTAINTPTLIAAASSGETLGELPQSILTDTNRIETVWNSNTLSSGKIKALASNLANLGKIGNEYEIVSESVNQQTPNFPSIPVLTVKSASTFLTSYVILNVQNPNYPYANLFSQKVSNGAKVGNKYQINQETFKFENINGFDVANAENGTTLYVWAANKYDQYLPIQEQLYDANDQCIPINTETTTSTSLSIHDYSMLIQAAGLMVSCWGVLTS